MHVYRSNPPRDPPPCPVCHDDGCIIGPAGLDACPRCALKAEAEWKAYERERRRALRLAGNTS